MNAHRQIALRRELELGNEHLFLAVVGQARLPAVQTNLAYSGGGGIEKAGEALPSSRGALADGPRMIAEARQHLGIGRAKASTCSQSASHAPFTTLRATPT